MSLKDFIKPKSIRAEDFQAHAVQTFEKNVELYKGKSLSWNTRITADELGIKKDELCEILDEYYGSSEEDEE